MSWTAHYFDPKLNRDSVTRGCTSREGALRLACDLMRQRCRVYFIQGPGDERWMRSQWSTGARLILRVSGRRLIRTSVKVECGCACFGGC